MNKSFIRNNFNSKNEQEKKYFLKKIQIFNQFENILIKDSKDDFIMKIKQIRDIYELIEDNEAFMYNKNKTINNNINKFSYIRMEPKYILTDFGGRVSSICSIKEKNNIYNKLLVGFNNGKILIYNLNNGKILLEISEVIKNEEIFDICDLKKGIIACSSGLSKISIINKRRYTI